MPCSKEPATSSHELHDSIGSPSANLDDAVERAEADLRSLRGQRILVTGGTGFVGRWMISMLMHADQRLNLGVSVLSLSRDPTTFSRNEPEIAAWCEMIAGDVRNPIQVGQVDTIIHTATPASADLNDRSPSTMRQIIVAGMQNVLALSEECDNAPVLFTSSGAVYGPQPFELERMDEEYQPPSDAIAGLSAYATGKRAAEAIAQTAANPVKIARLFTFVGPHLPLDTHFAIGNFIRDAVTGGPIRVAGDGTAVRSYMYSLDLVVALIAVLVRGEPGRPYNVGSDAALTIASLAESVRDLVAPEASIDIAGLTDHELPGSAGNLYVPSTERVSRELRVECFTSLETSIRRTATWARTRY